MQSAGTGVWSDLAAGLDWVRAVHCRPVSHVLLSVQWVYDRDQQLLLIIGKCWHQAYTRITLAHASAREQLRAPLDVFKRGLGVDIWVGDHQDLEVNATNSQKSGLRGRNCPGAICLVARLPVQSRPLQMTLIHRETGKSSVVSITLMR